MSSLVCLRKKAGLSQQYIADHLGISQAAVSQWERGASMPIAAKLPILAKLLGCTTDELLEGISEKKGTKTV